MTPEQILEYQKLRDEYTFLANMIATTVTFSVGGCVVIFGLIINSSSPSIFLFGLPLLIIYPACLIIISRFQSIVRIAAYIIVFLEPAGDLKYETRYLKFKTKSKKKLTFSQTIFLIYLGLIIIDIGLFTFKNFYSVPDIILYAISIAIWLIIFFFVRIDWRGKYIQYWQEVKNSE
jgi:hypothetical protein